MNCPVLCNAEDELLAVRIRNDGIPKQDWTDALRSRTWDGKNPEYLESKASFLAMMTSTDVD